MANKKKIKEEEVLFYESFLGQLVELDIAEVRFMPPRYVAMFPFDISHNSRDIYLIITLDVREDYKKKKKK